MNYRDMMCSGAISVTMAFGCYSPSDPSAAGADTDGMETEDDTGESPGTSSSVPSDDTNPDDTGPEIDVVPPSILSVSPAHGETGVRAMAEIVVTFSEPMDKVATQAAYQSADLSAGEVTMTWNSDGDELTIVPNDPLKLGEGFDPEAVDAISYAIRINTSARDLAGNALEEDYSFEFSTARLILEAHPVVTERSGCVTLGGEATHAFICVGEDGNQASAHFKGFATFDISELPDGIIELAAEVQLHQVYVYDAPYETLGDLMLHHVEYADMSVDYFQTAPLGEVGVLSTSPELGERKLDVSAFVWDDYESRRDTSQYRLEFELANDFDDETDAVLFGLHATDMVSAPRLLVLYLLH